MVVATNSLHASDREVILEPKIMSLLAYFCSHPGDTINKLTLLKDVWGGVHYADSVVTRAISILRSSLEDDRSDPQFIRTVARRGYQMIAPVQSLDGENDAHHDPVLVTKPMPAGPSLDRATSAIANQPQPQQHNRLILGGLAILLCLVLVWFSQQRSDQAESVVTPSTRVSIDSIAVTPFQQIKPDEAYGYLADSLHQDIAMQLARHEWPRIHSIPASRAIDQAGMSAAQSAGADALLTGVFEVTGDQLAITLTLQDPFNSELLWTADYADSIDQTYSIRQQIIRALVSLTRTGIEQVEQDSLAAARVNPEAYQTYLKARWHWRQRSLEDVSKAHALFIEVTELDPEFADGFAGLALSHITRINYLDWETETSYREAAEAANQALALDPSNAEALTARAQVVYHRDWNFNAAIEDLQQAIRVSPGVVDARQYLAEIQSVLGQHEHAIQSIDAALQRRPYSALLYGVKGLILNAAGHYDQVGAVLDQVAEYDGEFIWHDLHRAQALERTGQPVQASLIRLAAYQGRFTESEYQDMAEAIRQSQGQAFWVWMLDEFNRTAVGDNGLAAIRYAEAQAANGHLDVAMQWIRRAMGYRGEAFLVTRISPWFDALRERDDYRQLLREYGLQMVAPQAR